MADRDWVPDFRALAARRARLLGVSGEFYDHRNSAENEPDWPGSWLRAIVATEDLMHQNWPGTLWLAFADSPVIRVEPFWGVGPYGCEGFHVTSKESVPPRTEPQPQSYFVEDISELPPFTAVVGTSLEAISVLTWDGRLPDDHPVGIRLIFEPGDIWLLNRWDEMEVYDRRPPFWQKEAKLYDLREWEWPV